MVHGEAPPVERIFARPDQLPLGRQAAHHAGATCRLRQFAAGKAPGLGTKGKCNHWLLNAELVAKNRDIGFEIITQRLRLPAKVGVRMCVGAKLDKSVGCKLPAFVSREWPPT